MVKKVRALVMVEPGRFEIREFPYPEISTDSALIRMELSGICLGDKRMYKGQIERSGATVPFPIVPGHENVGVIAEIGDRAAETMEIEGEKLKIGDRVVISCDVRCEECYWCKQVYGYGYCENVRWIDGNRKRVTYGLSAGCQKSPHLFGGMAEYIYIIPGTKLAKVPEGVPPEVAVLTEPMAVVLNVFSRASQSYAKIKPEGFGPYETLVVQGPGIKGILHILWARIIGTGQIIMTGSGSASDARRLEMAKEFGVEYTINEPRKEKRISKVLQLTQGRGADLVIECAGVPEAVPEGLEMLRRYGGTYIELGNYVDTGSTKINPWKHICSRNARIFGCWSYTYQSLGYALKVFQKYSHIPFGKVVTHKFTIAEAEKAYKKAIEAADALKVVISP